MGSLDRAKIAQWIFGAVLIALGAYFAGFGGWLMTLGGTVYYLITGVAMALAGVQVVRGRSSAFSSTF